MKYQRGLLKSKALAGLLAALLFWSGLGLRPALALTYAEERQMGREVLAKVKTHMKMVEDDVITGYVDQVGRKILDALGSQPFDYHFYVIDKEVINAFAVPAGYIFINSEVIASFDSEGQLAAILAHEIAHVTSRHISKRIEKSKKISLVTLGGILAGALIGGSVGAALMTGSIGGGIQAQLAYSREDEREADRKGLNYLVEAGYNPEFLAEAFQIMIRNAFHAPKDIPTYLTTHPGLSDRIGAVETAIRTHAGYGRVRGRGDQKAFEAVKDRVLAVLADPARARNYFRARLKKDPTGASAHYGLGLIYQKEQNFDQAIREFQLALKSEPANANFLTDLGEVQFQKKDFNQAMTALGRALVLRPKNVRTLYLLARTYEELNMPVRARELYERVLIEDPRHADTLRVMGLIYGREGDLARAHLHTGRYFLETDQIQKAMYHFEKAREYSNSTTQDVRDKIEGEVQKTRQMIKEQKEPY